MKTEEKAKKVQNIATALAAIFGAVGAFFGIFQAQMSANLKNQVTSLQNASQQTIVNVISTLGDDAQAADLAQSGDTVAITEQLLSYPLLFFHPNFLLKTLVLDLLDFHLKAMKAVF